MGSCKECYHYEVCRMHYQQKCELTYETEKEVRRAMLEAEKGNPICDHFKDRSRFVELPCKVGDTVYFIKGGRVMSDTVIRFVIDRYAVKLTKSNGTDIGYTTQFGERIFLTRKEAEQALRSVIQND